MALIRRGSQNQGSAKKGERGISLLELLIAITVLVIGLIGVMALVITAIANNSRNRQQSNATVLAQMVTEKIGSIPAETDTIISITDCSGTANQINTAAGGANLLPSGDVDFTQDVSTLANYSMSYTVCGTNGRNTAYDVRWNIQAPTPAVKLVTVSAKLSGQGTDLRMFAVPVTVRTMTGQ